MNVQKVTDKSFRKYGRVLEGYSLSDLLEAMKHTPLPDEVIYVPSVEELEAIPAAQEFKNRAFGGLPIQIGYCNGKNKKLNALEYHRSSEINVAVTDMILLTGMEQDVGEDYTYDTSHVEAFFVPAGTAVEMYATTLHYAPCMASETGFRAVVVLPAGTNTELDFPAGESGEERLITAKNKWLIAHEAAGTARASCGVRGENIEL